ncbi:MAG: universal stress protein [Verrucomicrobiota bacterium]|nr:universal stress protein [Verrucomicrobiota bacterium]
MRVLICSDGTDPADKPARLGGLIAGPCKAATTLLGISESAPDEAPLRAALESEMKLLAGFGVEAELVVRKGDPVAQILEQTSATNYDLVVIGTRGKQTSGRYWRSHRTYEVIKAIPPPVLVASGDPETLSKFLVCTGGKHYIEAAVKLTAEIAARVGASVTLLHVMAEPPAIFANLVRMEEDVDGLLAGSSELGQNLLAQKKSLEKMGVTTEVRIRHGIVLDQVFEELNEGEHDLIVTGSSQARGALQHYIMGDLTRRIVNRAPCPVLVARPGAATRGSFWGAIKRAVFPARA